MPRGKSIRVGIFGLLLATIAWQLWPEVRAYWLRVVGPDEVLIRVCRDGRWGFIDEYGRERIPLQWAHVGKFNTDGWAQVLRGGQYGGWLYEDGQLVSGEQWGFINRQGQIVIEPQWEWVDDFDKDGFALVQRSGKGGVIDRQGRVVVEPQWSDTLSHFFADRDRIRHGGHWNWMERNDPDLSETGKERMARIMSLLIPVESGGKYGYTDWQEEVVIAPVWDEAKYFNDEGLARVKRDDKWGWINRQGQVVIDPQWDDAVDFDEMGLAQVRTGDHRSGKSGWINCRGVVVIDLQYDTADRFDVAGMAKVQLGGEWGWKPNDNGTNVGVRMGGKWGWIDRQGHAVGELQWDEVDDFGMDGWTRDTRDGKEGWYDRSGSMSFDPQWDVLWNVEAGSGLDGWVRVKRGNQWGWIDRQGRVVIEPQWEESKDFGADGWAQVKRDGQWGWIDRQGRVVIETQWEESTRFSADEWARVKRGGHWGWVDRQGRTVIAPLWESCTTFSKDGWAQVKRDGKWGWIDRRGHVVIEPRWAEIERFDAAGLASVSTSANFDWLGHDSMVSMELGSFGYPEYRRQFKDSLSTATSVDQRQQSGVWGMINRQGQVVIKPRWNHCDETVTHHGKSWYVVSAHRESSLHRALGRLPGWVPRLPIEGYHSESACYDSTGRMIWSSEDRFRRRLIGGACAMILVLYGLSAGIRRLRAAGAGLSVSTPLPTPAGSQPLAGG